MKKSSQVNYKQLNEEGDNEDSISIGNNLNCVIDDSIANLIIALSTM